MLTVTDTGHGMSAQTRAQIFEPFFTTKRGGQGHRARPGHGLRHRPAERRLDRRRPATIGDGTTFTLYFPATRRGRARVGVADDPQPGPARVAGEHARRRGSARGPRAGGARRCGASATTCSRRRDGDEAFARFGERASLDPLLLTDVVMPGMNGRELAERLRERQPAAARDLHVRLHRRDPRPAQPDRAGRGVPGQAIHPGRHSCGRWIGCCCRTCTDQSSTPAPSDTTTLGP